jgi:diguanylate cyclase (GGDEF)-like protein
MDAADQRIKRGDKLCVFAIDLDHFKSVNDTSGHGVGDAILKMVASRLRTSCREGDVVARLGGDEFAVLTEPLLLPQDAAALADRIVTAMAEPFEIDGRSVLIGASVGSPLLPATARRPKYF